MTKPAKAVNPNHIFVDTNVLIGGYSGDPRFQKDAACLHYLYSLTGKKLIAEIEKLEFKIEIFPNPTSGKVTVTSPEPLVAATLTDLMGRREEVRLIPKGSIQYSIDFTSRPQGVYLLKLTTADGRQHTLKLLKQSDIFAK